MIADETHNMDWNRIFLQDFSWIFALEIIFRGIIMFAVVMVVLKIAGKRGVRQLSVFELAIIISLGSAVGDPMIYDDVGILPAALLCFTVILFYRFIIFVAATYKPAEIFLEGAPVYIIENGVMVHRKTDSENIANDEFFSELRLKGVEHLGQVRASILETTGSISVFFYEDADVIPGLPILPKLFNHQFDKILKEDDYACSKCGKVRHIQSGKHCCHECSNTKWVKAQHTRRVK